jgi:HPt (histidine-containing phosphotransfer) domain-containing protein
LVWDLDDGDRAVRAGDLQALRRVAHNLKSALAMLGQEQAVQVARATEEHAAKSAAAAAQAGWKQLSRQVRTFVAQGG